jgi:cytochrome o ubiquinol oxidase operon protein cyoD
MNEIVNDVYASGSGDIAPGQDGESGANPGALLRTYLIGLGLATGLTVVSFWAAQTQLIYAPGIAPALVTLAIAQMGIHLIFFLHITTAPDSTNNVLALAFGVLIVLFVVLGSIWIMDHLNHMMPSMDQLMRMQR